MEPLLNSNTSSRKMTPPMDVEDASSSSSSSAAAAAVSAFRRRNKILILVLFFLILLLCIVLSVLIAYFGRHFRTDSIMLMQPRARTVVLLDFNTSRILLDSLRTAADKLQGFVSFLSTVEPGGGDFVNFCSSSAMMSVRHISSARKRLGIRSDDTRMKIVDRMKAAAEEMESCIAVLERVKAAAAVREAAAAVREVVDDGVRATEEYGAVLGEIEDDVVLSETENGVVFGMNYGIDWRAMVTKTYLELG